MLGSIIRAEGPTLPLKRNKNKPHRNYFHPVPQSFHILTVNSAAKRGKQFQTLLNITFPITILADSQGVFKDLLKFSVAKQNPII